MFIYLLLLLLLFVCLLPLCVLICRFSSFFCHMMKFVFIFLFFLPKYIYMLKPKGTGLICIVHQLDREKKIITRIRQFFVVVFFCFVFFFVLFFKFILKTFLCFISLSIVYWFSRLSFGGEYSRNWFHATTTSSLLSHVARAVFVFFSFFFFLSFFSFSLFFFFFYRTRQLRAHSSSGPRLKRPRVALKPSVTLDRVSYIRFTEVLPTKSSFKPKTKYLLFFFLFFSFSFRSFLPVSQVFLNSCVCLLRS